MAKIATFRIESSFKLQGRGLVALGQIVAGVVRVGAYTRLDVGYAKVTIQIAGVDMADTNREKREFAVALTFFYKDEVERKEFEAMKLKEQLIDILDEPE